MAWEAASGRPRLGGRRRGRARLGGDASPTRLSMPISFRMPRQRGHDAACAAQPACRGRVTAGGRSGRLARHAAAGDWRVTPQQETGASRRSGRLARRAGDWRVTPQRETGASRRSTAAPECSPRLSHCRVIARGASGEAAEAGGGHGRARAASRSAAHARLPLRRQQHSSACASPACSRLSPARQPHCRARACRARASRACCCACASPACRVPRGECCSQRRRGRRAARAWPVSLSRGPDRTGVCVSPVSLSRGPDRTGVCVSPVSLSRGPDSPHGRRVPGRGSD